ncbi:hypothetical protein [Thermoleptolyngbya sp. M55_K2018_002]|uniref:hypothetical protein n=1 Tax=Thermoleptolyngbya sp. M55_K2018_002 TaxID=2747808 RepID=UPI0019EC1290|nr:hypothetical protein [Thermoleptolyngbya sp. M55_K2018_002]HIK40412.1 hypothetical protein [Thermoleptolyngbya sp. M55_K2018_002]
METATSNGHKPKTVDEVINLIHNPPPDAAPPPPDWTAMDSVGNQAQGAAIAQPATAPAPLAQQSAQPAAIANVLQALKTKAAPRKAGQGKSNPIERLVAVAAAVSLGAWLSTGKGIAGFMVFQSSHLWLYLSVALLLAAVMKWQQSQKMDLLTFSLLAIAMAGIAMLSGFLSWLLLGTLLTAGLIWMYTDLTNGGGIEYPTPIIAAVTAIALLSGAGEMLPKSPQQPLNQPVDQQQNAG